ncbi:hypothetical protein BASA83_004505 [Batrachochytrium salamandrivorans]|nr:hypothetical protein BASA83_004505 [Batrachochytrium salamandrivorans]
MCIGEATCGADQSGDLLQFVSRTCAKTALLIPDPLIPRIIHQTWKDEYIPKKWQKAHGACNYWHPRSNWTHYFWTDSDARELIKAVDPEFLKIFDGYRYPIQRVDAVRYFILYEFGGIYMDLDIGCLKCLEPLLRYPAIIPKTTPIGFSNDFMASRPKHPMFKQMVEALPSSNQNLILPYATVFFSTGPMFLNMHVKNYLHKEQPLSPDTKIEYDTRVAKDANNQTYIKSMPKITDTDSVWVLEPLLYSGGRPHSFFMHFEGNSWHSADAVFILKFWSLISQKWTWLETLCFCMFCLFVFALFTYYRTCKRRFSLDVKTRRVD